MTVAIKQPEVRQEGSEAGLSIADLVLLRVTAGGATRADLQRDLAALVAPRVSGTQFRRAAELAIGGHAGRNLVTETRGRLSATASGTVAATAFVVPGRLASGPWPEVRDALVLKGAGIVPNSSTPRALQRVESLAALVLQRHFGLSTTRVLSPTDLRSALAIVALERAFGNKIKTGLGKGSGLPAKAGRLLAAQLCKAPREYSSDGKLILALAGDVASTQDLTLEGLKLALLRKLTNVSEADASEAAVPRRARAQPIKPDNDATPLPETGAPPPSVAVPPDMSEFCSAVLAAARPISEGWPGNRKAFISLVWRAIRHGRPDWGLSEIAFKGMLAEAHRCGRIELVGADLKDGRDPKILEDSRILYKNTIWHFVRVED